MGVRGGDDFVGQPFIDGNALTGQTFELLGVVAHEAHRLDAQVEQHLERRHVAAHVGRKAQAFVGLDGVGALILKGIGANLVGQPDAAAFLIEVNQDAPAFIRDAGHGRMQLRTAVAAGRVEDVAGDAA